MSLSNYFKSFLTFVQTFIIDFLCNIDAYANWTRYSLMCKVIEKVTMQSAFGQPGEEGSGNPQTGLIPMPRQRAFVGWQIGGQREQERRNERKGSGRLWKAFSKKKLVLLSKKTVPNLLKNTLQLDRQLGTKSVSKTQTASLKQAWKMIE